MAAIALRTAAWAQSPAAVPSLPVGTPVTIVSDETVDPRVHPGSEFRAHLRDPLALGSTLVAIAGTPARIVVKAKDTAQDGTVNYRIGIVGLNLGEAGILPVQPTTPSVDRIATGMAIAATTLAAVGLDEGKVRVAAPLPFKLSNEPPAAGYTPAPLRTAAPIMNRRKPTPTPTASPTPAASGSTQTASPVPAPSAVPT